MDQDASIASPSFMQEAMNHGLVDERPLSQKIQVEGEETDRRRIFLESATLDDLLTLPLGEVVALFHQFSAEGEEVESLLPLFLDHGDSFPKPKFKRYSEASYKIRLFRSSLPVDGDARENFDAHLKAVHGGWTNTESILKYTNAKYGEWARKTTQSGRSLAPNKEVQRCALLSEVGVDGAPLSGGKRFERTSSVCFKDAEEGMTPILTYNEDGEVIGEAILEDFLPELERFIPSAGASPKDVEAMEGIAQAVLLGEVNSRKNTANKAKAEKKQRVAAEEARRKAEEERVRREKEAEAERAASMRKRQEQDTKMSMGLLSLQELRSLPLHQVTEYWEAYKDAAPVEGEIEVKRAGGWRGLLLGEMEAVVKSGSTPSPAHESISEWRRSLSKDAEEQFLLFDEAKALVAFQDRLERIEEAYANSIRRQDENEARRRREEKERLDSLFEARLRATLAPNPLDLEEPYSRE